MADIASLPRANHGSHFRPFERRGVSGMIDPFLGVDHAWMSGPTFPPCSHSGFSAVSCLFLDPETGIINRDSVGSHHLIKPGGMHWATAGSGIIHEEVPAENSKTAHSLQIFMSLPTERRHVPPFTLTLEPQDIPVVQLPDGCIRVPAGRVDSGHCVFVMPVLGKVSIDEQSFGYNDLRLPVYPAQKVSQIITLYVSEGSCKVMFFSGRPLN